MCMQRNKVRFLTDAEVKYTTGQEGVSSHVKLCFFSGRDQTEAQRKIQQEKQKEGFVIHQLLIRLRTGMDDAGTKTNQRTEHRLSPSCQKVCVTAV